MDHFQTLILGKFFLTFSVLLGIPIWQLYSLRRERLADERARARVHPARLVRKTTGEDAAMTPISPGPADSLVQSDRPRSPFRGS